MQKHELLKSGESIIRVLEIQDKILIIDCVKQTMPVWIEPSALDSFSPCADAELMDITGFAHTMIAPVLPFIANEKMRTQVIRSTAKEHDVTIQTIRKYLCCYLAYLDIAALVPLLLPQDTEDAELLYLP